MSLSTVSAPICKHCGCVMHSHAPECPTQQNEYEVYLAMREHRENYRRRCASANLVQFITDQQDIDGQNAIHYCREYEKRNGLPLEN